MKLSRSLRCWTGAACVALAAGCAGAPQGDVDGTAAAAVRATRAALGPAIRPEQLKGLPAAEVTRVLGTADFRRSDGPAEIWQYRDGGCVLDVYLYVVAPGELRVTHAQSRDRSPLGAGGDRCTTHLFREVRNPASS